jgi:prepilin-type N-terminal cleavage/methylation domain-containing protein
MASIPKRFNPGFTFLEIITVLALISILALVVMARYEISNTNLPARTQVLKSHLRYAQSRAMNSDTAWGIQLDAATDTYRLFNSAEAGDRPLPGEDAQVVDLSIYGLAISSGDLTVTFDTWGRPCADAAGTAPFDMDRTVTLADTDGKTNSITITRNTGYIP